MHSSADVITIDLPSDMRRGSEESYGTDEAYFMDRDDIGRLFKASAEESRIRQIYADSMSKECQIYLDAFLKNRKLDFAFIDAAHDYESVKHNFENLVQPKMAESGVVLFDDYNRPLTHVGVSHFLMRKAHDGDHVFYWYAPHGNQTSCVIFVNVHEARSYDWKGTVS